MLIPLMQCDVHLDQNSLQLKLLQYFTKADKESQFGWIIDLKLRPALIDILATLGNSLMCNSNIDVLQFYTV